MTTVQEVAARYYDLVQTGEYEKIRNDLYSPDAVSIESENKSELPLQIQGLEAMRQKEYQFFQQIEAMHGGFCGEPIVSSYHFACTMGMDVTMKGQERRIKEQLGVFEVQNGKIVKEQFFYNDFD